MECRLVYLPLSIRYIVKDGVIYLNARHSWATLERALEGIHEHSSNKEIATAIATAT